MVAWRPSLGKPGKRVPGREKEGVVWSGGGTNVCLGFVSVRGPETVVLVFFLLSHTFRGRMGHTSDM